MGARLESVRRSAPFHGMQKVLVLSRDFSVFASLVSQSELETKWAVIVFCIIYNKIL